MSEKARMAVELQESVQRTYDKSVTKRTKTHIGPTLSVRLSSQRGRAKQHKGSVIRSEQQQTISRSTVNTYVAAMVDLWQQQAHMKINSHPSPRDDAVSALLKLTEYNEDERNLRNLLVFLLDLFAFMRGESTLKMELADLHLIPLENEDCSPCRVVVIVMGHGKTNQWRLVCLWGTYVRMDYWPYIPSGDGTTSERCYSTKLLKTGKNPIKEMPYKVHREAIATTFDHVGIVRKAKTCVRLGSGSRMADLIWVGLVRHKYVGWIVGIIKLNKSVI
ncbi:hypothetical protein PHMEG_00025085 [Phytophthora megakarya]|uniref:Ndc10 domain-containing protein n=1 Tax=Phytophthora megakarya TaxID=4795 RepID=A0A225VCI9_9STRA|nr:hypothetical protein PHMEG_00025085 [Phytophthora megakarya]